MALNWIGETMSGLLLGGDEDDDGVVQTQPTAQAAADAADAAAAEKEKPKGDVVKVSREDLQDHGMLTKEQFFQMFEKFHMYVQTPEGKQRLADVAKAGGQPENETTTIQKEKFEECGIEGDHGVSCMKKAMETYQDDHQFKMGFMQFCQIESMVCDEAELGPEKFAIKLKAYQEKQQKRLMAMRAQMMAAGGMNAGGGGHGHSHGGMPCQGHGHAGAGHSHGGANHGHSHGGADHGHSHGGPGHSHGGAGAGHSHNGQPCHGHGGLGEGQGEVTPEQQEMIKKAQEQMKFLMQMTPEQRSVLQQKAQEHYKKNEGSQTPQEVMRNALAKLQKAQEDMKANGLNEQEIMDQALKQLTS